jgi:hypothetical protein
MRKPLSISNPSSLISHPSLPAARSPLLVLFTFYYSRLSFFVLRLISPLLAPLALYSPGPPFPHPLYLSLISNPSSLIPYP